jgi:hypothetical protein
MRDSPLVLCHTSGPFIVSDLASRRFSFAVGLVVSLLEVGDPDFLDGPLACPVGCRQLE